MIFDGRLIFARSVNFQIDDVTITHCNGHNIKTKIITNILIIRKLSKILGDLNHIILKIKHFIYRFLSRIMKIFTKNCQTSGIKEKSYRKKFFE